MESKGMFQMKYIRIGSYVSNTSRIFDLPKLHNPGVSKKPIVSSVSSTHNLAVGKYTVKNSFSFVHEMMLVKEINGIWSVVSQWLEHQTWDLITAIHGTIGRSRLDF